MSTRRSRAFDMIQQMEDTTMIPSPPRPSIPSIFLNFLAVRRCFHEMYRNLVHFSRYLCVRDDSFHLSFVSYVHVSRYQCSHRHLTHQPTRVSRPNFTHRCKRIVTFNTITSFYLYRILRHRAHLFLKYHFQYTLCSLL